MQSDSDATVEGGLCFNELTEVLTGADIHTTAMQTSHGTNADPQQKQRCAAIAPLEARS